MTDEQLQQIKNTIKIALDSVWVVDNEIEKKNQSGQLSEDGRKNIERNVAHLEIVLSNPDITNSGEDTGELSRAITAGKAALA